MTRLIHNRLENKQEKRSDLLEREKVQLVIKNNEYICTPGEQKTMGGETR